MANRTISILVAAACFAILPPALLHFVGQETVHIGGWTHFIGVALGAGLATASAVALTLAGTRRRDGYAVLVGCAFSVMAALLCLHGLSTPGVLVGDNGVVAFTGGATLPIGGALLALGTLSALRRPTAIRPLLSMLAAGVVLIFALGFAAIAEPALVPSVPEPRSPVAWTILVVGLAFYAVLFWRALRTYRLTRRGGDLLVAVGIVWLAAALPAALLLDFMDLGWWLGHAFEIVGIAAVGFTVAVDLTPGTARSRPLLGDLKGADLVAEEEEFLGSHIRALLVALADKDAYTEEHTRRVALRAVQVGDELGLAPERLRDLAVGGLLHDIGKLSVPDHVLRKPGLPHGRRVRRGQAARPLRRRASPRARRVLADGAPTGAIASRAPRRLRLPGCGARGGAPARRAHPRRLRRLRRADLGPRLPRGLVARPGDRVSSDELAEDVFDRRCVRALERVLAAERPYELAAAV